MKSIRFCNTISYGTIILAKNQVLCSAELVQKGNETVIKVSDVKTTAPAEFKNELQQRVYEAFERLDILFERVDTDEIVTKEDCAAVDEKLDMKMVKTLFLCNRQQTRFYLFITCGDKPFKSKDFSAALGIARVSFASAELMESMLGTKIGAATILSALLDCAADVCFVMDKTVAAEEYYGCSDGTTTSYLKLKTADVCKKIMSACGKEFLVAEV